MKISESVLKFLGLDGLVQNLTGYVEARIELMKVEVREDVAKATGRALVMVALFLIGFLFLVFFSVGLAHFLNQYFEAAYVGFWVVAGIYLATFTALFVFRKGIQEYFEHQLTELIKTKRKNNGTAGNTGS